MAPADQDAVARDLAMFRRFEPAAIRVGQGRVVVTVGEHSPPPRHHAAWALHDLLGVEVRVLPGTGHFVQHDNPEALVAVVRSVVRDARG
jgi:pimeloyl-ACP methyl ester carboxylesterase